MAMRTLKKLLGAGAAGVAAEYFLDPQMGRTRRARTQDQIAGLLRRRARRTGDLVDAKREYLQEKAQGLAHEMTGGEQQPENDRVLVDKVRSEVLGREEWRPYTINVNAVDGVVTLRGQLDSAEEIRELRDAVGGVTGVREVESFLHLPNTEAPNKAEVR